MHLTNKGATKMEIKHFGDVSVLIQEKLFTETRKVSFLFKDDTLKEEQVEKLIEDLQQALKYARQ